MNKVRGAARLLVIVSIAVSGIGLAAAPATAAEPTLTVTPTTNLLDHHPVRVTGTGFVPGATYVIVDCTADACVDDDAYWLTMGALQTPVTPYFDRRRTVVAAPDGTISTSLRMSRTIYVGDEVYEDPSPDLRDCSAEPCTLAVVALADVADRLVEVPVSFQATGTYTWTPGTLTVDAPARLPDQGTVPVSGTGWDPGSYETAWWGDKLYGVKVEMCATGPGAPVNRCQLQAFPYPAVDHDGVVGADVRVDRFLDLTGGLWDCAAKPCALRIGQGSRLSPEVPVTFGAEWSPFASAGQMVDRLSIAVTGAVLPAAERNPLVSGLAGGTLAASSVLRTLVERPGAPSEVATLYASILQRRPDTAGLAFWVARRRAGTTAARIAEQFANTPEVRAWHQELSDAQAVSEVYQRVLGRPADAAGQSYWVGRLGAGLTRAKMIASFALSPESRTRTRGQGAWTTLTLGIYGRAPGATEWGGAGVWDQVADAYLREAIGSDEVRALAS